MKKLFNEKFSYKRLVVFTIMLFIGFIMNTEFAYASGNGLGSEFGSAFKALFDEYKLHLAGFIGFGLATSLLAFVVNFIRLGNYSDNPQKRSEVVKELIAVGICTALLGSVTVIGGILYSIF